MSKEGYIPDLSLKKPGEQKKVQILEETVEKGTLQDLRDVLETYKTFELTARALGLAARYRGIDFVKTLVEHGATFIYHRDTRFGGRYDMYQRSESFTYWTDYALMLIPDKLDFSSYKPLIRSRSSQGRYEFTPLNGILMWIGLSRSLRILDEAVLSLDQRLEITDYLSQKKVLELSLDDMLYWALIWGETAFADGLIELGAGLRECEYLDVVTNGINRDSYIFAMSVLSRDKVLPVMERLYKQAEIVGKKPVLSQNLFDVVDWEDRSLSFALTGADLTKINQIKALEKAVTIDGAASLTVMEDAGWLKSPARRERMIRLAQEQKKTDALAFLIDYKNRMADLAEEDRKQEAKVKREMTEKPDSVAALKKLWKYEKMEDGTLSILEYKGEQTEVFVPGKIGKDIVTVIGKSAFATNQHRAKNIETRKNITSVVIQEGIQKIQREAFYGCESLKEISIPCSVNTISERCFAGCRSLKNITIPDSVTEIGKEAFYYCSALKTVRLPDTVGTLVIGENLFEGCSALKVIENKESIQKCLMKGSILERYMGMDEHAEVPEGTTGIGKAAFRNNMVLKSVSMPDSLNSIEDWAFNGCGSLDSVIFPQGLVRIGEFAFYGCSSLSEAILPSSLKEIGYGAFMDTSLKEVEIPESVNELGERAFSGCASLRTVTLPSSLTEIRYEAFKECVSLQSISIPESVRKIGTDAFSGCKALEEVIIPETVTEIGDDAFKGVPGVKKKKVTDTETNEFSIVNGSLQEYHGNEATVTIPEGVHIIEYGAFRDKKKIKKVIFPDSLREIRGHSHFGGAFEGCTSLGSISVPKGVKEIGARAFAGCKGLKKAELPGVRIINKGAFTGCVNLQEVVFGLELNTIDGEWHNGAFEYCSSLTEIDLPEGTEIMNQEAFAECGSLRKVKIPSTMRKIGWRAFYSCNSLVSFNVTVAFPEGGVLPFGTDTEAASKCIEFASKDGFSCDQVYLELIRKGTLKKKVLRRIALMRLLDKENLPDETTLGIYTDCVRSSRSVLIEEALRDQDAKTLENLDILELLDLKSFTKAMENVLKDNDQDVASFASKQKEALFGKNTAPAPKKKSTGMKTPATSKQNATVTSGRTVAEEKKLWLIRDWHDGTLGIYGYKGDDTEITIPAMIGKKRVTTLFRTPYKNFAQYVALTKVIISEGIEKIEEKTFEWWFNPGLTEIVIPASVTEIEEQDFRFPEDVTIYGVPGSCAEKYAEEHGISFVVKT